MSIFNKIFQTNRPCQTKKENVVLIKTILILIIFISFCQSLVKMVGVMPHTYLSEFPDEIDERFFVLTRKHLILKNALRLEAEWSSVCA